MLGDNGVARTESESSIVYAIATSSPQERSRRNWEALCAGGCWTLGRSTRTSARACGANAEALAGYRQAVHRAAENVENALSELAQTEAHVGELQAQGQSLSTARDLAEQAYRAGSITLDDVLDAARPLLATQDELDTNRVGSARAAVGVFRALGGGWEPPTPKLTRGKSVAGGWAEQPDPFNCRSRDPGPCRSISRVTTAPNHARYQ